MNVKGLRVEKGVDEVLLDAGVALQEVEAVVWSHWHFDHVGDLSRFPTSTKIVVGPGFKENLLPGYPANPESPLLESDYAGKEMEEISVEGEGELRIGMFRAYDFFGMGVFICWMYRVMRLGIYVVWRERRRTVLCCWLRMRVILRAR